MAGFQNDVLIADNVDFTGVQPTSGKVTVNGQLLIGSAVAPNIRVGTLTSSGGTVTITPGPGTINLESAAAGFAWNSVAAPTLMVASNGYFATAAVAMTLPAAPVLGTQVKLIDAFGGGVVLTANAGHTIRFGNVVSSVAGTATTSAQGDSVSVVYDGTSEWYAEDGEQGIWALA